MVSHSWTQRSPTKSFHASISRILNYIGIFLLNRCLCFIIKVYRHTVVIHLVRFIHSHNIFCFLTTYNVFSYLIFSICFFFSIFYYHCHHLRRFFFASLLGMNLLTLVLSIILDVVGSAPVL